MVDGVAKIYRPARTAMQSGQGKTKFWLLEYEPASKRQIDRLTGTISSDDMAAQIRLKFPSKDEAVAYAQRKGLMYHVSEPAERVAKSLSYSDNFSFKRTTPWTH